MSLFEKLRKEFEAEPVILLPILTTESFPGKETEYVDLVSASATNIKDLKESLSEQCQKINADAVIGVRIEAHLMTPVVLMGYGTAVRFKNENQSRH